MAQEPVFGHNFYFTICIHYPVAPPSMDTVKGVTVVAGVVIVTDFCWEAMRMTRHAIVALHAATC